MIAVMIQVCFGKGLRSDQQVLLSRIVKVGALLVEQLKMLLHLAVILHR